MSLCPVQYSRLYFILHSLVLIFLITCPCAISFSGCCCPFFGTPPSWHCLPRQLRWGVLGRSSVPVSRVWTCSAALIPSCPPRPASSPDSFFMYTIFVASQLLSAAFVFLVLYVCSSHSKYDTVSDVYFVCFLRLFSVLSLIFSGDSSSVVNVCRFSIQVLSATYSMFFFCMYGLSSTSTLVLFVRSMRYFSMDFGTSS